MYIYIRYSIYYCMYIRYSIPYSTKISRELNFAISRMKHKIAKLIFANYSHVQNTWPNLKVKTGRDSSKKKKKTSIRCQFPFFKAKGEEERTYFGRVSSLSTKETIVVNEIVEKAS